MHEDKFNIIEGREMTLESLGYEIEEITGMAVQDFEGDTSRFVAKKPNLDQEFETFNVRYDFKESHDFVDVVFTTEKKDHLEDYDFDDKEVKVQLITYKRMDAPMDNESDKVEEQ
ncbi:hypothetical protein J4760_09405 [Salinicoccus sp. ID82-1]|nr:hypothetical protein [Salinicoccus sp. ID82-1]MCG1010237.1 hypothetical protein [Salinicoccus sp. ID82-1]